MLVSVGFQFETPAGRLAIVLLSTFAAIFLGWVCVYSKHINPEIGELKALSFFVGKIAFPLLIFRTVATANFGTMKWSVIIACNLAKAAAYVFVMCISCCWNTGHDRLLCAVLFSFFVVASNDFAIGFPVIDALYPVDEYPEDLPAYLALNAMVNTVFFVPITLIFLSIAKRRSESTTGIARKDVKEIAMTILQNPVMIMTIAGVMYQQLGMRSSAGDLNSPLKETVDLMTQPFTTFALFLTGASSKKLKLAAWPVVLVIVKVLFCAVFGVGLLKLISADDSDIFINFTYLYGSIATSSAPLVLATEFAPEKAEAIATSIILCLLVSGPTMFFSSILFVNGDTLPDKALLEIWRICVPICSTCVAAYCAFFFISRRWFFHGAMKIVPAYGACAGFYFLSKILLMSTICSEDQVPSSQVMISVDSLLPTGNIQVICFGICQNLCRAVTVLLVWSWQEEFPSKCVGRALLVTFAAATVIGTVTPPNTLTEICRLPAPPALVWRTTVTVYFFLLALLYMFWKSVSRHNRRNPASDLMTDQPQPDHEIAQGLFSYGLNAPFSVPHPRHTTVGLGIHLTLRLGLQATMGTLIAIYGRTLAESPSFQQIMIIEHLLEDTQLPLLLLMVFVNPEFQPVVKRVLIQADDAVRRFRGSKDSELRQGVSGVTTETFPSMKHKILPRLATRSQNCVKYSSCISGAELADVVLHETAQGTRVEAADICKEFLRGGCIRRVDGGSRFYDCKFTLFHVNFSEADETCSFATALHSAFREISLEEM
eukprot:TRINITY_DN8079_c0_g1_i3.p1 TRINITY_DN8079_c0_g1~~TRINITY_DN8079_c0_g1_i3.p1  ORF type:complete len:793 (-),score=70.52 TRINITY_DN8079_c0_g1_i3:90-2402(-)